MRNVYVLPILLDSLENNPLVDKDLKVRLERNKSRKSFNNEIMLTSHLELPSLYQDNGQRSYQKVVAVKL